MYNLSSLLKMIFRGLQHHQQICRLLLKLLKFMKMKKKNSKKFKELINKQHLRLIIMQKKMKTLRYTNRMLKNKINNNDKYKKAINLIFNEDQINALFKKRIRNWSNKTIQRALKLKFACGVNNYTEILKQGIPLPSLRTLSRKLEV